MLGNMVNFTTSLLRKEELRACVAQAPVQDGQGDAGRFEMRDQADSMSPWPSICGLDVL
jgi:hypothetical protein